MRALIFPGQLTGEIKAPPSKSITQRAYAAALLHIGRTVVYNAGDSADEQAALHVIQQLGARIVKQEGNAVYLDSNGVSPIADQVSCGESGLAARLFTPIAALSPRPVTVNGAGSLLKRPMEGFRPAFRELGVSLADFNGFLPVTVHGPLESHSFKINAAHGSQFLSGLLFAITATANKESIVVEVADLKSRPYIDLTLDMLEKAGRPVINENYHTFIVDPTRFVRKEVLKVNVEGDWSGTANLLVGGAISGNLTIRNLNLASRQADKAILQVLREAGASFTELADGVKINAGKLNGFFFDATHCPDLFPILSILASCSDGESRIKGVHRLFNKESNRVESIAEMLQQFGVHYSFGEDELSVFGEEQLNAATIDSYNDHRIVMAAAIGALRATGPVTINEAGVVAKSYPGFFKALSLGGITVNEVNV